MWAGGAGGLRGHDVCAVTLFPGEDEDTLLPAALLATLTWLVVCEALSTGRVCQVGTLYPLPPQLHR